VYVRVLVRGGEWMEEMWMWGNIVDWLHIYTYENIFHIYMKWNDETSFNCFRWNEKGFVVREMVGAV
jgi:hypothetical protein